MILRNDQLNIVKKFLKLSSHKFTITVSGESMEPTIKRDQLITVTPISLNRENIKKGDIILYKVSKDHFTIHRVIHVLCKNKFYITKGDNNKKYDKYIVKFNNIVATLTEVD